MSDTFSGLPKFPVEEAARRERLREMLGTEPEPEASFRTCLWRAYPILLTAGGVAGGLLLVLTVGAIVLSRAVAGDWLAPLVLLTVFATLPTVAVTAAAAQRARRRRDREADEPRS
ncbi:hypothetical protein [Fimbriiglobus ruber]|uniref:Uncharacterized protein n=1 Tax=Fimbriiglobus ruber TaxID=1908690 RepID=A0A225DR46_9BACT|nr:hypothetical protein [Fimbriiglobus ruber]OWK41088.1 hypothetical protein FRUB_04980 [Fimbriiglobus ruber]